MKLYYANKLYITTVYSLIQSGCSDIGCNLSNKLHFQIYKYLYIKKWRCVFYEILEFDIICRDNINYINF